MLKVERMHRTLKHTVISRYHTLQNINVTLKLPLTTCYGSFLFCLEILTKNKGPLQALAIDNNIADT